jgi:hypothetical protein
MSEPPVAIAATRKRGDLHTYADAVPTRSEPSSPSTSTPSPATTSSSSSSTATVAAAAATTTAWLRELHAYGISETLFDDWLRTVRNASTIVPINNHELVAIAKRDKNDTVRQAAIISLADSFGFTALHYACSGSKAMIVKQLLELGANVDARSSVYVRAISGMLILSHYQPPTPTTPVPSPATTATIATPISETERHLQYIPRGTSPLHISVRYASYDATMALLSQNRYVFVDGSDDNGQCAIEYAIRQPNMRLVKALVAYGADENPALKILLEQKREQEVKSKEAVYRYEEWQATDRMSLTRSFILYPYPFMN